LGAQVDAGEVRTRTSGALGAPGALIGRFSGALERFGTIHSLNMDYATIKCNHA